MQHVFKDLVSKCWWPWFGFAVAVVSAFFLGSGLWRGDLTGLETGWLTVLTYVGLCVFLLKPIWCAAIDGGHKHLLTVCVWTFFLVVLFVPATSFAFYSFLGEDSAKYDKVLNVVPVFVAIWAAGLGWLVHFRLSTKAQRTNNAFSILMETRKSREFLDRAELVGKHFAPGSKTIPEEYRPYFVSAKLSQTLRDEKEGEGFERARAVHALKYILNYYEFMAVGIKAGDLDEDLIYNTIGPPVLRIVERAKALIDQTNSCESDPQKFAFIEIVALCKKWKDRLADETAALDKMKNGT